MPRFDLTLAAILIRYFETQVLMGGLCSENISFVSLKITGFSFFPNVPVALAFADKGFNILFVWGIWSKQSFPFGKIYV